MPFIGDNSLFVLISAALLMDMFYFSCFNVEPMLIFEFGLLTVFFTFIALKNLNLTGSLLNQLLTYE
jgi:hypothetical protein